MSKISDRHCEVCFRKGIQKKARTLCDECREFYCKECSDNHLLYKASLNHSLIDLDPPGEEPRSASEDELASDFLEHATVSETTVLYRAQVAVESGPSNVKEKKKDSKEQTVADLKRNKDVDISKIKPRKITEFSVKRPDDKQSVAVSGVLSLSDKVIIVDCENKNLKLFDSSGEYLSSTDLKKYTWGITCVNGDRFATCGWGEKQIFFWTLRGQRIIGEDEVYDVDHDADGIHYNNTYYCVLHHYDNAITILDSQGRQVRKIVMKKAFEKKIEFGWDIHMDTGANNIYVPCVDDNSGVLCMSVEGSALWFTPFSNSWLCGITEIYGALCISDYGKDCLQLISKTGQYKGIILGNEELGGKPDYIRYDEQKDKLYVSHIFTTKERYIISVYSVL